MHSGVLRRLDGLADHSYEFKHGLFGRMLFFQVQCVQLVRDGRSHVRRTAERDRVGRLAPRVQMRVRGGRRLQPRQVRLSPVRLDGGSVKV